ncbi:MAG: rhodanese-like domain-containing protein [Candidatus Omnitrophica bacterium]|nr:rhodanese-like domain-containing protein [Candidatus Omnitrophota bacterium]
MDNIVMAVSPKEAFDSVSNDKNTLLLDVRTPMEYDEKHIDGAVNIPIDALAGRAGELAAAGKKYIIVCRSGHRASLAYEKLVSSGIRDLKVLDGGVERWEKDKLPVVKGKQFISLERQVRVIAGILILLGIFLSWAVGPLYVVLPLCVAFGLIHAGVTDSCCMGLLLMKLPYNKNAYNKTSASGSCCSRL